MLKEHPRIAYTASIVTDLVLSSFAAWAAYAATALLYSPKAETGLPTDTVSSASYLLLGAAAVLHLIFSLSYTKTYGSLRFLRRRVIIWRVCKATFITFFNFTLAFALFDAPTYLYLCLLLFFLFTTAILATHKILVTNILHLVRRYGYNYRVVLVVGYNETSRALARNIATHPEWGLKVHGFVNEDVDGVEHDPEAVVIRYDDIADLLSKTVIDEVVFALRGEQLAAAEPYIELCERMGIQTVVATDINSARLSAPTNMRARGIPYFMLDITPHGIENFIIKRGIDMIVSLVGLLAMSWLFIIIAIAVKASSEGPIFFSQVRCGLNGRKMRIYKFRTMYVDAEDRLEGLRQFNERTGPIFKMKNDPRVTPVGRLLRKSSLDELPQLFNVLKGNMSLVGPRPPLPEEVAQYAVWQKRRLSVRPGIACIHEVSARDEKDFVNWIKLDFEYIDNWSLALDLKIIMRSIHAVFKGTGS